jgi:hypothetical protein
MHDEPHIRMPDQSLGCTGNGNGWAFVAPHDIQCDTNNAFHHSEIAAR